MTIASNAARSVQSTLCEQLTCVGVTY